MTENDTTTNSGDDSTTTLHISDPPCNIDIVGQLSPSLRLITCFLDPKTGYLDILTCFLGILIHFLDSF